MINTRLIFGPPGTGKTTTLLNILDDEMREGTDPARIVFVSFTRKAVHEARERVGERFTLTDEDTANFRTLHSYAYRQLGLSRNDVVSRKHLANLGEIVGRPITCAIDVEEGLPTGGKEGDQLLFLENLSRATGKSLRRVYDASDPAVTFLELEHFARTYSNYKKANGIYDFTDMLTLYITECDPPDIDVVIVDEAQDLFPLQWRVVEHVSKRAKRAYLAGDDDQAIYGWAGADVSELLGRSGERTVLEQSYRLPRAIFDTAGRIAGRINLRQPKTWRPRPGPGACHYIPDEASVDITRGNWMLLARNVYLLQSLRKLAEDQGVSYTFRGKRSLDESHARAILGWETLRKGGSVPVDDARNIYKYLRSGHAVKRGHKTLGDVGAEQVCDVAYLEEHAGLLTKAPWFDALSLIPQRQREYYRSVLRRGGKLFREPSVHINTIHGVKGGEADNVMVLSDMARRSYEGLQRSPDDEHRVFYVAATRARRNLYLVMPQSRYAYEWS